MGPVGQINGITKLITCMLILWMKVRLAILQKTCVQDILHHLWAIMVGHMGFATDLPFCTAYPLSFVHKDDPMHG